MRHAAAHEHSAWEETKLHHDGSRGLGMARCRKGCMRSGFPFFTPRWRSRHWPPRGEHGAAATDEDLGLILSTATVAID